MIDIAYRKQLKKFMLDTEMSIPETGITVLFGPSGSGKTSLLNLLAGLDDGVIKVEGRFKLNGIDYDDSENRIRLKPWQRNIAYVFQDTRLFPHMTVEENVLFGFKRRNSKLDLETIINLFGVKTLLSYYPAQLSGGQKQRVAMARAILSGPDMLILDEPLAALDFSARQELLPYIESIHKQLTIPVVYVSHDIKEVLRLADYIVLIDKGRVIAQGDIASLCYSQPLLTQAEGASFILQGVVNKLIGDEQLVEIQCDQQQILITGSSMPLGKTVRILIHARDVSICLEPPQGSSILNCIAVTIESIEEDHIGQLRVSMLIHEQKILAMISRRSARTLDIKAGKSVFAMFKATALIK